ncbi:MAG: energy transducer TonB [Salinibacter sp.]
MTVLRWIPALLVSVLLLAGCGEEEDPSAPPSGWQATDTQMWSEDVDTAEVFRDLEDLVTMGIIEEEMALSQGSIDQDQFEEAIKRSLVRLYRNNPEVVDSLFQEHAVETLEDADLSGNAVQEGGELNPELLQTSKKNAYQAITDHFREPQREEGADLVYPDSLRQDEEASGSVELQVHIDTSGAVDAVQIVEGVHPTLDAIAMKAATATEWESAYVMRDEDWVPEPSWARFSVNYPAPQN